MTGARDPRRALWTAGAAAFVAVAVGVRFVTRSPLWLDEALSVHIADLPLRDITGALRHDGHPPLYYWLLHGWMSVVGDGDVAVRALSGIFGVAALPLAWVAGHRVGGHRVAWAALLLVAWSPFAVRYSTEARMYSLVMALVLVGHVLVRRAVDDRRAPAWVLVVVAAVTATLLLTQYWTMFLVAAAVATVAWWGRRAGTAARTVAVRLVAAIVVGGLALVPWLPSLLEQREHTGTPWAPAPRPTVVAELTLGALGGGEIAEAGLLAFLLVVLLVLGLLGRPTPAGLVVGGTPSAAVRGEAAVVALTLGLGAAAGIATASTFAVRYASVVVPLMLLIAARGLAVLPGRWPAVGVSALLIGFGGAGIIENIRVERTQAGELAELVATQAGPDDAVVTCPDQLGPAMRRALDQEGAARLPVLVYPTLGDGRLVDWYDYEARNDAADPATVAAAIDGEVADGARVWVAWNGAYRTFDGDCEALLNALAGLRGGFAVVAEDGGEAFFEHAGLVVFG